MQIPCQIVVYFDQLSGSSSMMQCLLGLGQVGRDCCLGRRASWAVHGIGAWVVRCWVTSLRFLPRDVLPQPQGCTYKGAKNRGYTAFTPAPGISTSARHPHTCQNIQQIFNLRNFLPFENHTSLLLRYPMLITLTFSNKIKRLKCLI